MALPKKYTKFVYVFNKIELEKLLLYQLGLDYKINIRPGLKLPFGPIYNLFKKELYYLRKYLNKIEKLGFIRKLTSKVALLIIFVAKKDSDLRPIVDFRAINAIIVPNRYPIYLLAKSLTT